MGVNGYLLFFHCQNWGGLFWNKYLFANRPQFDPLSCKINLKYSKYLQVTQMKRAMAKIAENIASTITLDDGVIMPLFGLGVWR